MGQLPSKQLGAGIKQAAETLSPPPSAGTLFCLRHQSSRLSDLWTPRLISVGPVFSGLWPYTENYCQLVSSGGLWTWIDQQSQHPRISSGKPVMGLLSLHSISLINPLPVPGECFYIILEAATQSTCGMQPQLPAGLPIKLVLILLSLQIQQEGSPG